MKRVLLFLMAVVMLFGLSACRWDETGPEPTSVETHEEVGEDGNTYTVTTTYIDSTGGRRTDPSFYKWMVIIGIVTGAMSAYFWYRAVEIETLKKRCTVTVPGYVTKVRESKTGDRTLRSKFVQYNATYRYTYNGNVIESQNEYYGGRFFRFLPLRPEVEEGKMGDIHIDPMDPYAVFDVLANNARNSFIYSGSFLGLVAIASFVSYFIV